LGNQNYPLDDPASYMRLCLKVWREITQKPLIVTAQAYWGDGGCSCDRAEHKLGSFINTFTDWSKLQGLNWWHFGGCNQDTMSSTMYFALKEAKLNKKFSNT